MTADPRRILTPRDIDGWVPASSPLPGQSHALSDRLRGTADRMRSASQWTQGQVLGRRMPIGCVALEITQRCNLDCTYCYLSESSEALKDIPLAEVFRRIDLIVHHYGPDTDVQVTGGEPTLRRHDELVAIVARLTERGLRASLFTNGIKVTRVLLKALCDAGLVDVAFHVDLTQERKGFDTEESLNVIRDQYMELAKGLPVAVMFNTTLFSGNIAELPELVRFFTSRHANIRMVSFQLGADTGRGAQMTTEGVSQARVIRAIQGVLGTSLNFNAVSAGHVDCNRYGFALFLGGKASDLFANTRLALDVLAATASARFDRRSKGASVRAFLGALLPHPWLVLRGAAFLAGMLWRARGALLRRPTVGKLSFFIHNFMDAQQLQADRCEACSFMVMTPEGPLSMCVHNAKRDQYLLQPARLANSGGQVIQFWNPVSGALSATPPSRIDVALTRKTARGRARERLAGRGKAA